MSGTDPVTPADLGRQVAAVAVQLRQLAASPAGEESPKAVRQLVPLAAQVTVAVAAVVNTADDPLGTGRHNLETLRALGQRLTAAAEAALSERGHGVQ